MGWLDYDTQTHEVKVMKLKLKDYQMKGVKNPFYMRRTSVDNEPTWVQKTYGVRHGQKFIKEGWAVISEEGILISWVEFE
jgi:hypothetical protein